MKKYVCLALMLAMLLSIMAAMNVSAGSDLQNVALGAKYGGTPPYTTDAANQPGYRTKVGNELTDGVKESENPQNAVWYAVQTQDMVIDVDLGSKTAGLSVFNAVFIDWNSWGINPPKKVSYYGSDDGDNFTLIGEASQEDYGKTNYYNFILRSSEQVSYRYVRMEAKNGGGFLFCSEIEVFKGEVQYEDKFELKENVYAKMRDNCIRVVPKTDAKDFGKLVNSTQGVTVQDKDGAEKTTGKFVTGDTVVKYHEGGDKKYFIVVDGDVDGDGEVKSKDYVMVKRAVLGTYTLSEAARLAADVNDDNKVQSSDYVKIKRHVLSTYNLFETYGPQDGRGDVTSILGYKVDISDRIENPETWDMTLKRTTSGQYQMTCKALGGDLSLTFHDRPWSTWNLGAWVLKVDGKTYAFTSESTDWEYVYRAAESKSSSWYWSGGNHGNERLQKMTIYDGTTGKEINLKVGESVSVKKLCIKEETKLYYDARGTEASQNYAMDEDKCYANAVRNYTVIGPQIKFAVDYDYIKDVFYDLSYTCMFPIDKDLGLYCAYINEDGTLDKLYETLKVGDPGYNGASYISNTATRAILFGYGGNEKYKVDVRVDGTADTINKAGRERSRFWDMNSGDNKLYFCIGGNRDQFAAGSKRHTECQWTMFAD